MFHFHVAYRYSNGEIEGFCGTSLTDEAAARRDAVRKVKDKVAAIQVSNPAQPDFQEAELIDTWTASEEAGLTIEERDQIKRDWDISRRSRVI
jgi:hypothetical protein